MAVMLAEPLIAEAGAEAAEGGALSKVGRALSGVGGGRSQPHAEDSMPDSTQVASSVGGLLHPVQFGG